MTGLDEPQGAPEQPAGLLGRRKKNISKHVTRSINNNASLEHFTCCFCLNWQVLNLGREVADLGQVMKRMAQLMETLMSSGPQTTPACSSHHTHLPHTDPPPCYPCPPSSSQTPSVWTDTPPSRPEATRRAASRSHTPREPQLGYAPSPFQAQASSIMAEARVTSSPFGSPETHRCKGGFSTSIRSRVRGPLPQDGSGANPQCGLVQIYQNQTKSL